MDEEETGVFVGHLFVPGSCEAPSLLNSFCVLVLNSELGSLVCILLKSRRRRQRVRNSSSFPNSSKAPTVFFLLPSSCCLVAVLEQVAGGRPQRGSASDALKDIPQQIHGCGIPGSCQSKPLGTI